VLAIGFEMPAAAGTSLLVIAINSAAAFAARLSGHVSLDWPLLAVFTDAMAGALSATASRPGRRVPAHHRLHRRAYRCGRVPARLQPAPAGVTARGP
jgi:uncharacterized membrane protein YfcA